MAEERLVDLAYPLLMAAILLRDLATSMHPKVLMAMPADMRERLMMTIYQDAFNRLPQDVQDEARAMVMAEPSIQEARRIDAENCGDDHG